MVGGRERFIAYNSARRGSPELKLGGPVGLVVPVRTPDGSRRPIDSGLDRGPGNLSNEPRLTEIRRGPGELFLFG